MIKSLRYYTRSHPIHRDGLEVKFLTNGMPCIRENKEVHVFSKDKFFEWTEKGYISEVHRKRITIDEIAKNVCISEGINIDVIFNKTRKREIITARQIIQYFGVEYKTGTLGYIGWKTGRKNHATVLYSHKTINGYMDSYPEWRARIYNIKESFHNYDTGKEVIPASSATGLIDYHLKRLGIEQKQMAYHLQISAWVLNRLLKGHKHPTEEFSRFIYNFDFNSLNKLK